jgi:poly-gamma-glutamate biosynthesis protein PgsC/CapC
MDYSSRVSLSIAVGIVVFLFYARKTGWSAGGFVVPGLLSLQISDPLRFGGFLLLAVSFFLLLRPMVRIFSLYGRERTGAALLLAITFRLLFESCFQTEMDIMWIGWIAPGLIAADMERQGVVMTLAAVVSATMATAMTIFLLSSAWGRLI